MLAGFSNRPYDRLCSSNGTLVGRSEAAVVREIVGSFIGIDRQLYPFPGNLGAQR